MLPLKHMYMLGGSKFSQSSSQVALLGIGLRMHEVLKEEVRRGGTWEEEEEERFLIMPLPWGVIFRILRRSMPRVDKIFFIER